MALRIGECLRCGACGCEKLGGTIIIRVGVFRMAVQPVVGVKFEITGNNKIINPGVSIE